MKILRIYYTNTGCIESINCSKIDSILYVEDSRCLTLSFNNEDSDIELTVIREAWVELKELEKDLVCFLANETSNKNIFDLKIELVEEGVEHIKKLSWGVVSLLI